MKGVGDHEVVGQKAKHGGEDNQKESETLDSPSK